MNIPYPNSVVQSPLGAAVRDGRAYRIQMKGSLNDLADTAFFEFDAGTSAILLHSRMLSTTSGPVNYGVFLDYGLAASPYLESAKTGNNLNQLKTPVRPSTSTLRRVDPSKVAFYNDTDYLSELVPSSETFGRNFSGMMDEDDLYNVYPPGAKALIRIETEGDSPPDTKYLLKFIFEEYDVSQLIQQ